MVKSNAPDCAGVPESVPPDDNARPVGKVDADHVKGGENAPPAAVNINGAYGTP